MLLESEIAEEYTVTSKQVKTPYGWCEIKKVYKTIPLRVWELFTIHHRLEASAHHLVLTPTGCKELQTLNVGDTIFTETGLETIFYIAPTNRVEPLYDITIDNPNGLFYSQGIVSHNSTTFCARQLIYSHLIPRMYSLYIAPYEHQVSTYGDRMEQMQAMFSVPIGKQNKYSKKFENGSSIRMISCLTTADKARGISSDEILFDECQGMDPEIIPEILYTKTMSELPTVVYSGTALSVDTLLEANWIDSSMGMWHVRAGDGKTWLNMFDKETLFKVCDNIQGPTCPITGKLLKVTDGCFVHAKKGNMNAGRIGVHIPQCIIPDIAYNAQRWTEVYQKIQRDDPKKVMQECFGIAVSEGSREISERDLIRLCTIPDTEEQLKEKCHNGFYKTVISGCDWGGSDYNPAMKTKTSYTVHCIIGIAPDGCIDILHYRRYAGMMYDEIARTIVAEHKAYKGFAIASDFGVGLAYNMEIRKQVPFDRHFIMSYVGPNAAPVSIPAGAHMQNQLSINRTEALTNVFRDVKRFDPQRIRCRNWGDMQPFLSDWLNMFRVPVEMPGGQNLFKYVRAATKADDALHAFAFAYVLAKIYRGDSLVKDPALEKRIRAVLGAATIGQKEAAIRQEFFGMPNYVVSG
jgi:hypothetical protein